MSIPRSLTPRTPSSFSCLVLRTPVPENSWSFLEDRESWVSCHHQTLSVISLRQTNLHFILRDDRRDQFLDPLYPPMGFTFHVFLWVRPATTDPGPETTVPSMFHVLGYVGPRVRRCPSFPPLSLTGSPDWTRSLSPRWVDPGSTLQFLCRL